MNLNIEAIFLDTGNTMRIVEKDATFQYRARQQIAELIGTQESPDVMIRTCSDLLNYFPPRISSDSC